MLGLGLASPELLEKLLAGFRARLLENIMRVTFHRAERKMHFAGDVLVVFAVDYRAQNILFARGEAVSIAIQRKICGYVALLVACFRNRGSIVSKAEELHGMSNGHRCKQNDEYIFREISFRDKNRKQRFHHFLRRVP